MSIEAKKMAKVKSLYDIQSFSDKAAYAKGTFKDAGGIILARNLEHVSSEIFTQEYSGLTFLNSGVIVNNEGGFSTSIQKLKLAVEGGFKESGTSTNTTGKITLTGETDSIPSFTFEGESDWSEHELGQAELQNINLPSRYFDGHAELYNRKIDELGYLGQTRTDGTQKTLGLLNFGFTASASTTTAALSTGDALYGEIADLITDQWAGVLNVETFTADRVAMADTVYNICAKKIMNSAGSEMSVLKALEINFPSVTFVTTAKARDIGGSTRTTAYSSDRRAMQMRIPIPLKLTSVDQRGIRYYVESYFAVAGLDVIESTAGRHLTGL
tara:strand:- start:5257 stop:6240 length:984 start_codon:yes stop_codon:yes gene_type:complete